MGRKLSFCLSVALAALAGLVLMPSARAMPGATRLTRGDGTTRNILLSAEGRFVAFESFATNIHPGDTNAAADIYLHDRADGSLRLVTAKPDGTSPGVHTFLSDFSPDGRYMVFSGPTSLTPDQPQSQGRVGYLYDVAAKSFIRLPEKAADEVSNGGEVLAGTGFCPWAWHRSTGVTVTAPFEVCRWSGYTDFTLSADGSTMVWSTLAPHETDPWAPEAEHVLYAMDTTTGAVREVSTHLCGNSLGGKAGDPAVSADGRFVAFNFNGTVLPGCVTRLEGGSQVYVKDLETGVLDLASQGPGLVPGDTASWDPSISDDGRFVTFASAAATVDPANLVFVANNQYVRDRLLLTTTRIGLGNGEAGSVFESTISGDGSTVGFVQWGLVDGLLNGGTYGQQAWVEPNPAATSTVLKAAGL